MDYARHVDWLARQRLTRQQCADGIGITLAQVNSARTWLNSFCRPDAGLNLID